MAKKNSNLNAMARKAGLPPATVYQRVNKLGWSVEKALNTPTRKIARNKPASVAPTPAAPAATTKKPSPVIPDAHKTYTKKRVEQLEAELLKAKKQCKLAQIAALIVIVAVVAWAVNP
jgi:hypothetical protein